MKDKKAEARKTSSFLNKLLGSERSITIIVICGIIGVGLVFISSHFEKPESNEQVPVTEDNDNTFATDYKQSISEELGNMISSIEGAGKTKIMVTLGGTVRNIYATDTDINDKDSAKKTGENQNTDKQNTEKKKYILVREKDGSEKALSLGQLVPEIKGVLVICEGGDNEQVRERITDAVSAALNITRSHICVTVLG